MAGIDVNAEFHPLKFAVLTVSDTRDLSSDTSGALLVERITSAGHQLVHRNLVKDDVQAIQTQLIAWIEDPEVEIILSTGGTGFSPRDNTPEAVRPLLRKEMDGFSILFHQKSMHTVGVSSMQSRALAGQAGDSFIFCIPGSTGACKDAWDGFLELEFDSRHKPCSIASSLPRFYGVVK